ncbi:MAG: GNAT family N-acyltransferase [Sulfurimonas sp.]|nr:GNAT family N-acyltransferase [Sulfurimonas sp.]
MLDIEKMIVKKYPKFKESKILNAALSKFADSVVHQDEINNFVEANAHLGSLEFTESVLEYLNFNYTVSDKNLENIPSVGRVVIIANHPLGGLDAFALIKLISRVRKDIKIVANEFLSSAKPIAPILIDVNNFKSRQTKDSINKIYEALNNEEAVIIFPSGEVSRATPTGVRDGKWHKGFLKFAKRSNSPILPVHIGGKNSKTFYSVSALNKKLSTLLLAHELFSQRGKSINIIVGEVIPAEFIYPKSLKSDKVVALYKRHLYSLKKGVSYFKTQKAIALPEDRRDIKKELKNSQLLGSTKDGKSIYLYEYTQNNSSVLNELGRLREVSFRKVGEGVNKKRDIDKYDRYYKHIVLWDNDDLEIVGAYRIGIAKEIQKEHGTDALYTKTLFEYTQNMQAILDDSIELGRSFVQPKYWGSRALDYLWQGIGAYLKNNPQIKYMFGGVSLSESYPKVAQDMILYFYELYFSAKETYVRAQLPYVINHEDEYLQKFISELDKNNYKEDFRVLKQALSYLNLSVPVLYKQYADLCESGGVKFCAFNIDREFSNCVDSFIIVDVEMIKDKQRRRYFGELKSEV